MSALAKRYARALFDLANERGRIDRVESELNQVVAAVQDHENLKKLLMHPHIAPDAKKALAHELFSADLSEEMMNFLGVLIDNRRESQLAEIAVQYVKLANDARGIADAVVTTAKPLTAEEEQSIADTFGKKLNKKLRIQTVVDPVILGGVIVKIGDRLYDGSIKTKLERFAHQH